MESSQEEVSSDRKPQNEREQIERRRRVWGISYPHAAIASRHGGRRKD